MLLLPAAFFISTRDADFTQFNNNTVYSNTTTAILCFFTCIVHSCCLAPDIGVKWEPAE